MRHPMLEKKVSGITTDFENLRVTITADDGFTLIAHRVPGGPWHFNEYVCTVPTRVAHFSLRKQVHFALNPMRKGAEE